MQVAIVIVGFSLLALLAACDIIERSAPVLDEPDYDAGSDADGGESDSGAGR